MSDSTAGEEELILSSTDLENMCRTCLLKQGVTSLDEIMHEEAMNVRELLRLCTNIQVDDDNLPQNMCSVCINDLSKAYQFITKCKRSDSVLHSLETMWGNEPAVEVDEEYKQQIEIKLELSDTEINTVKETKTRKRSRTINCLNRIKAHKYKQPVKHTDDTGSDRTCRICSKVCAAPFLLKQHMRSHTNERPYHCDTCPASFTNSSNLRRHIRIHSGERPHICDVCGKGYTQSTTLIEHKRTHSDERPYVCCYCGKTFRSYSSHKNHLAKHHLENEPLSEDDAKMKMNNAKMKMTLKDLICNQCGRILSSKGALKTHMLLHGEKSFLCSNCGKRFATRIAFVNHYRTHTGEKPYKCDRCEKSFSLQATLKQHILIHTGEKPYRCKLCTKGFIQYHQLKYHLRTHSGERPYICTFCGKAFALNGNLTVHKRIHTGETPYRCSVCNKGFYDSSSMKKHKKGHEKDIIVMEVVKDEAVVDSSAM